MMKKYTFRLGPVLKLRKLKEENCRTELGQLISELNRIEDQLRHDKNEISNYYKIQELALDSGILGGQLQAFPMLVGAKTTNIQLLEINKKKQEERIAEKKAELAQLKGELKVIENLKDKDYDEYRKILRKEQDQKIEEQTQNWLQSRDKKAVL